MKPSALEVYKARLKSLSDTAPGTDIVLFDDYSAFTTVLGMADRAGEVLGDIGLLRNMSNDEWDTLPHLTIQYANVRKATQRLCEHGLSVALVMSEGKRSSGKEGLFCIAKFDASKEPKTLVSNPDSGYNQADSTGDLWDVGPLKPYQEKSVKLLSEEVKRVVIIPCIKRTDAFEF